MKTTIKIKALIKGISFAVIAWICMAQTITDLVPGTDRWLIKTSLQKPHIAVKNVPLSKLIKLPSIVDHFDSKTYNLTCYRIEPAKGLQEGDLIHTTGYLRLVALEKSKDKKDGDYHIQLTLSKKSTDSCFIVELPYEKFIKDKNLSDLCKKNRHYISENIFNGTDPNEKILDKTYKVEVTGQLFFDAVHTAEMKGNKPQYRGKKKMHSYTTWELHPITDIKIIK